MAKGCKNKGCKRQALPLSIFCRTHTALISATVLPQPRPSKKAPAISNAADPTTPFRNVKSSAYIKNFSLSSHNQACLDAINLIVSSRVLTPTAENEIKLGRVRCLVYISGQVLEEIHPHLLAVVVEATKAAAFPLKAPLIHAPVLVVAPEASGHSNAWTKGALHRDFDHTQTSGVYSFLIFLTEVTPLNGTVALWRHSKLIGPIDPKSPERSLRIAGLKSELLVGKEGTVFVFDSRLLHRSLANGTQNRRLTLQFYVTSSGRNGVSLNVIT